MQTKTYTVYKFEELTPEAQEKALDNLRYINVEYDWWEPTYDDAATIGLRITGFELDRGRHAEGEFMVLGGAEQCAGLIITEHGEATETYKTAKAYLDDLKKLQEEYPNREDDEHEHYDKFNDESGLLAEDFLESLLEDYSIMLQTDYEYQMGDEAVKATILLNEYDFTENGKLD